MKIDPDRYYSRKDLADASDGLLTVSTLAKWAMVGKGPKARHVGRRVVYYGNAVLDWIEGDTDE